MTATTLTIPESSAPSIDAPGPAAGADSEFGLLHRSIAQLCSNELPLDHALRLAGEDLADGRLRDAVLAMANDVTAGRSFAESYRERCAAPTAYAAIVEAGVACDDLPGALLEIAREERVRTTLRDRLEQALARPLMSAIVVGVLGVAILMAMPWTLEESKLTWAWSWGRDTRPRGVSNELWGVISAGALGLLAVGAIGIVLLLRRGITAERLARLPLLRGLGEQGLRARFASTLALLLRRELPLAQALARTREGLGPCRLRDEVATMEAAAERGESLAHLLGKSRLLSPDLCFYLASCEPRGQAALALTEIAAIEGQRFERRIEQVTRIAGPTVELAVGLVVFCFALFYLHPALRLMSGIFG